MRRRKLKIVKVLAVFFMFVGFVGWFLPLVSPLLNLSMELPNTKRHGIGIDSSGNIYCGSKFSGRIQKYRNDGKFLRGFYTRGGTSGGSDFGFYIDEDDNLCVHVARVARYGKGAEHKITIYDSLGELIKTEEYQSPKRDYSQRVRDTARDSKGNIYTFKGSCFPRIIKRTKEGDESVIIRTPILLWFFQGPFPAFIFLFVSIFVLLFFEMRRTAAKQTFKSKL